MAKLLKLRRGTTTQHGSFTGAEGEVTIDTDKDVPVVHDGSTAGGHPVAAEDMANVSSASIAGRLANDSLATSKLAAGALPSDVTVATANLVDEAVTLAKLEHGTSSNNGKFLRANNGADPSFETVNTDLVADTSPQLGGDLESNGSDIKFADDDKAIFGTGTGNDLEIFHESSSNTNEIKAADGDIHIQADNFQLISDDTGGRAIYLNDSGGYLELGFDGSHDARFAGNQVTFLTNVDANAGVDVTGNITVTGTVDGVNVGAQNTLMRSVVDNTGVIANDVTTNTQSAGNNTTRLATTAFVTTAIANADAFPSGTKMIFQQTSAPTGWTKITSDVDNRALRVVSGTAGTGGTNAFSNTLADRSLTANAANSTQGGNVSVANTTAGGNVSISNTSTSGTVNSHTLSTNEMPSHSHGMQFATSRNEYRYSGGPGMQGVSWVNYQNQYRYSQGSTGSAVQNSGGGGSHSHGFSGGSHTHNGSLSGTAHTHNANFSGSAHNHSISVGNLDMAVQYLDVIIASKD